MYCEHSFVEFGHYKDKEKMKFLGGCKLCGLTKSKEVDTQESTHYFNDFQSLWVSLVGKNDVKAYYVFESLSNWMNNFSYDPRSMFDALQESGEQEYSTFFSISLLWMKRMSFFCKENRFDGRNEYSVKLFDELFKALSDNGLFSIAPEQNVAMESWFSGSREDLMKHGAIILVDENGGRYAHEISANSFDVDFVLMASSEHRTLMQSFSRLVLMFLLEGAGYSEHQRSVHEFLRNVDKEKDFYRLGWMPFV